MRRLVPIAAASALLVAVPAWAEKPPHPGHPSHEKHNCTARKEGYNARGVLDSGTLIPGVKKDHFSGTITVHIAKANHDAPPGSQTFTLTDARVQFGKGVTSTTLAAGDRVSLHGKITVLPHGCSDAGFTPTVTVRNAEIKAPKN